MVGLFSWLPYSGYLVQLMCCLESYKLNKYHLILISQCGILCPPSRRLRAGRLENMFVEC